MRLDNPPSRAPDRDVDLRREHRRLRRAFAALLVAVAPAGAAQACGHAAPTEVTPGDDAGPDTEAGEGAEASPDADAAPLDAPSDRNCMVSITVIDPGPDAAPDADPSCLYVVPCGFPPTLTVKGCEVYSTADNLPVGCSILDGQGCEADVFVPGPGGALQMFCVECLGGSGRRPMGLARPAPIGAPTALGAYFARMAHDEAAAVHAFRRLRDELALHGAPAPLVSAAERSARDEERHARAMARRARAQKASIRSPRVRRRGARALEAIARENAVEGCVHETFGALLLGFQAAHARDASLRRTFARIAADETRHAALSWAVARWAEARLDAGGRARVARARARALEALRAATLSAAFDDDVGRPGPRERAALLSGMIQRLGLA